MKTIVVIPAFNEEDHIGHVIQDIRAVSPAWDIVVVDDASTDKTYEHARASGVAVVRHVVNRGQGAALRTGTEWALLHGADSIIHFDADGQFSARELPGFIEPLEKGKETIVLGSRFLRVKTDQNNGDNSDASKRIPWTKRVIILPVARLINWYITGIKLSDAHNGLRAFTRDAALKIRITQDRMAHNSNIVAEIKKHNLRFKEMPVTVYYHSYGQRAGAGFAILSDLFFGKLIK
ncbi:glycosyltransferase family 2 protein [Candidatus Peregrinibacteria bacterium]|nr:glycosyltransferase family 2 protein [Candidatus Peregrinibacteria bacterium]